MHVLFYPGLRHCGSPKLLKQIWGWSGWICWSGKELWEISQDSYRRHLEWHHSTFWLFLSHSKLGCSVFLSHLHVKHLLEPPEVVVCAEQGYLLLKEAGAVTQGMIVVQQCHFRGRAELHQAAKPLTLPKSDVGKCNFLCSWWEAEDATLRRMRSGRTKEGREGKRPGKHADVNWGGVVNIPVSG